MRRLASLQPVALALQELRGALLVFVILLAMFTDHASEKSAEVRPPRGGKGQIAVPATLRFSNMRTADLR